jgi:predicted permease
MESLFKDIRYGYRTLLNNPGFAVVAVLSLALGIGANTAIFSFINTVLLRSLPVPEPERLVSFGEGTSHGVWGGAPDAGMELFSWREYQDFRSQNQVFSKLLAINSNPARLYLTISGENSPGVPEPALAGLVSGNYFDALGVKPAAGRFFDAAADKAIGASPLAVLNDGFWERRFHRSAAVIGQSMRIADQSYTVIGVAPRGFFGTQLGVAPDFWIPLAMQDKLPGSRGLLSKPLEHFLQIVGRLRPGLTIQQAQADVSMLYQRMLPGEIGPRPSASDMAHIRRAFVSLKPADKGLSGLRSTYRMPLTILMIVVALVLVIACANVANLLLALAARRQKEFALRVAIGAGRARVIRQLITESLMLSGCGGLLGILFASAAGKLLVHLISTGPRAVPIDFDLDRRVLVFTVLISAATGVLFGLAPALRASRVDLNSSLKEGKASMAAPGKITFGRMLVAGQVALSFGLLVTAGLLLHSFENLISLRTGFERENVLLFKIDPESLGYNPQRMMNLYQRIEERVSRLPGVASQGVCLYAFNEGRRADSFEAPGTNLPEKERVSSVNLVSPGYFSALRIPIITGRALDARDTAAGPKVTVVSESFANEIYGGTAQATGRVIIPDGEKPDGEKDPLRIVGVARDAKIQTVRDRELKMMWRSVYQSPDYMHDLAVRVTGDPSRMASSVRHAIQSTDSNLPIRWVTTLADAVSDSLVRERAIAQLSACFAALALALSAIGLYGTISFAVARRTSEIGIRMALGAERLGVVGMVLRDAMMLVGAGLAIGLPLALLVTRELESMLYGLGRIDPISVIGSAAALGLVAAVAGYLPARRAAAVDPMAALRYE